MQCCFSTDCLCLYDKTKHEEKTEKGGTKGETIFCHKEEKTVSEKYKIIQYLSIG